MEFPGKVESTDLRRDNLSREIGRMTVRMRCERCLDVDMASNSNSNSHSNNDNNNNNNSNKQYTRAAADYFQCKCP